MGIKVTPGCMCLWDAHMQAKPASSCVKVLPQFQRGDWNDLSGVGIYKTAKFQ